MHQQHQQPQMMMMTDESELEMDELVVVAVVGCL